MGRRKERWFRVRLEFTGTDDHAQGDIGTRPAADETYEAFLRFAKLLGRPYSIEMTEIYRSEKTIVRSEEGPE